MSAKTLQLISQMMTRVNTSVKLSGEDASVFLDGKSITLPALPIDDLVSLKLLHGYLDHENAHVAESDFSVLGELNDPITFEIVNFIEDCRIERLHGDKYPGVRYNLSRLAELAVKKGLLNPGYEYEDQVTLAMKFVNYELQTKWLGYRSVYPLAEETRLVCQNNFPQGLLAGLQDMCALSQQCSSTRDVVEVAKQVKALLELTARDEPQTSSGDGQEGQDDSSQDSAQGSPQGDGSDESGNGEANQAGNGSDQNQGSQQDYGNGQNQSSENVGSTSADSGTAGSSEVDGASGTDESSKKAYLRDALDNFRPGIGGIGEVVKDHLKLIEAVTRVKNESGPTLEVPQVFSFTGTSGSIFDAINQVDSVSAGLRQRLHGLLQAKTMCRRSYADSGRKIVPSRLWRLKCGDPTVFQRKIQGQELDTCMSILVDASSSMGGDRIKMARESALAVALALDTCGVSNSIATFYGSDSVGVVKTFNERAYDIANRLPAVTALGNTPLYPALMWSVGSILQQRSKRKIVMILSDGRPRQAENCRKLINMMSQSGIEVIGLGIGAEHRIQELVDCASSVLDINELPEAMFSMLENKLLLAA